MLLAAGIIITFFASAYFIFYIAKAAVTSGSWRGAAIIMALFSVGFLAFGIAAITRAVL